MDGSSLTPQGATRAEARWLGASMKGRRRTCSPFEMLFKKSLLKAATVGDTTSKLGRNGRRSSSCFDISGLRPDLEDNTVLDIASYRWESSVGVCKLNRFKIIRREFQRFDENKDGEINQVEFGQFLRGIGLIPSDDEVKVGVSCLKKLHQNYWSDVYRWTSNFCHASRRYMNRLTRTTMERLNLKNLWQCSIILRWTYPGTFWAIPTVSLMLVYWIVQRRCAELNWGVIAVSIIK